MGAEMDANTRVWVLALVSPHESTSLVRKQFIPLILGEGHWTKTGCNDSPGCHLRQPNQSINVFDIRSCCISAHVSLDFYLQDPPSSPAGDGEGHT